MNLGHCKLDISDRISEHDFATLVAVLAVLALLLLSCSVREWVATVCVLLRVSPGLATASCVVALYYEDCIAALTQLVSTVVFLQVFMTCMLFLDVTVVDCLAFLRTVVFLQVLMTSILVT